MGQTLTHGIYLPDEGERNCYSGLAANWQILDTSVGTIAANTAALAGKAGLSANNTFSGVNSFNSLIYLTTSIRVNNSAYESGTPSGNIFYNPLSMGGFVNNIWAIPLAINGAIRTSGYNDFSIRVYSQTGNTLTGVVAETNADASIINFRPIVNKTHNLGNSLYKWKTLNSVNPGALSLPDITRKSSILEYITDLTGGLQYYTPLADGWICIQTDNSSAANYIRCAYDDILVKANGNGQAQGLAVLIPVLAGVQIGIRVVCTTLSSAYFYHCQGNVT